MPDIPDLEPGIISYLVRAGITSSTIRLGPAGRGVTGMREVAWSFCENIDLSKLSSPKKYSNKLDEFTVQLQSKFPDGGRFWGVSRKCINIFMRDITYNYVIRKRYELNLFHNFLEIPLDSKSAKSLSQECEGIDLTPWKTIKSLTKEVSAQYQLVANKVSERKNIPRVHLDFKYWANDDK